ncbi:GNAT family N-acetyltransferase [Paenisporosarcina indica]|uniref:GNAT family N-acetyltransferase n=1 Tax=Paenisporosarcina indica TaxID=650093 RepID=UPI0009502341|nr:GNAT family N-acetyltransferase [Paenisporosarcina indica]
MDKIIYRPSIESDIPQLYDLMVQYIVDFYKQPQPIELELKKLIQHLIDTPSIGLQFVADKEGKLVVFSTLYFTFSTLQVKRSAILNDLFVLHSARGQKVGEHLFETCLLYIRENNFAYMTWETAKDNLVAQGLYDKMGAQRSEWVVYEMD